MHNYLKMLYKQRVVEVPRAGRCNVLEQIEDVPDAEDGRRCWTIKKE